jgi:hypothetical protein
MLLGIVRYGEGNVASEVPSRLYDLEGWMNALERVQNLLRGHFALERTGEAHAQFGFETRLDQIGRQFVVAWKGLQNAAEHWLMKSKFPGLPWR